MLRSRLLAVLVAVVAALSLACAGAASAAWTGAVRVAPSQNGDDSIAAFAFPNGALAVASLAGISAAAPASPFPPPTAFTAAPYANAGWFHVRAAFRPDSSGIVVWRTFNKISIQDRAADGSWTGARQDITATGDSAIALDGSGGATLAYVTHGSTDQVHVTTRAAGDTSFADPAGQTLAVAGLVTRTLLGLVVDPDGAAVVAWVDGDQVLQAVRPAGAATFGSATVVQAAGATVGAQHVGEPLSANAAGRAVLAFYDTGTQKYRAAVREPGGAFGAPQDLGPATIATTLPHVATAVAQDGSAAVLADTLTTQQACPALSYWPSAQFSAIQRYGLAKGASTWTTDGSVGGGDGTSALGAALAGGPGSRIEASWWQDPAALGNLCAGTARTVHLVAGTLGGPMSGVYDDALIAYATPHYNHIPQQSSALDSIALNACGDGVLVFAINPVSNFMEDPSTAVNDGVYASTSSGGTGACAGAPPVTTPGTPPGTNPPPVTPAAGAPGSVTLPKGTSTMALKGKVARLLLVNPNAFAVTGTLKLATAKAKAKPTTLATTSFALPAAAKGTVKFSLTKAGRKVIGRAKRLRVTLTIITRAAGRPSATSARKLTLKRAR